MYYRLDIPPDYQPCLDRNEKRFLYLEQWIVLIQSGKTLKSTGQFDIS